MAYVPIPYPSVLYSAAGVPQPVATAAQAAALPADYAAAPTVAAPVTGTTTDPNLAFTTDYAAEEIVAGQAVVLVQAAGVVPMVIEPVGPIALLL